MGQWTAVLSQPRRVTAVDSLAAPPIIDIVGAVGFRPLGFCYRLIDLARSRRSSGGSAITASWIAASILSGPAYPPIPTRSKAPLLSLAPRARSAPFVPLCPKVPDLLENQDRWLAFSDDFRALTLLGRQYHRSHYC
jgi:hypothetical protein